VADARTEWIAAVAAAASRTPGAPVEFLGEYLPMLASAAADGRRPDAGQVRAVRALGRRAAEAGVGADQVVELYLSAAWRMWRELPHAERAGDPRTVHAAAGAVLRAVDDAVGALVEGHQSARRDLIRHEEALRREFVDDLLRGDADVARMVERAEPFGLDLGLAHHVALAAPTADTDLDRAAAAVERSIVTRFGDREVLVATKDHRIVVLAPTSATARSTDPPRELTGTIESACRTASGQRWRVVVGRAFAGAYGVARSYEEAREALQLAERLHLDEDVVDPRHLLVYRVLGRDQAAIVDLVRDVLGPLDEVRGRAATLVETLHAYFSTAGVATETARRLHVSVRTVTYRLATVRRVTGYHPSDPDERFALHAAVLGARLLDWPRTPLPDL